MKNRLLKILSVKFIFSKRCSLWVYQPHMIIAPRAVTPACKAKLLASMQLNLV